MYDADVSPTLISKVTESVKDILIACVDGVKGFPDAIQTVCPHAGPALYRAHGTERNEVRCLERL